MMFRLAFALVQRFTNVSKSVLQDLQRLRELDSLAFKPWRNSSLRMLLLVLLPTYLFGCMAMGGFAGEGDVTILAENGFDTDDLAGSNFLGGFLGYLAFTVIIGAMNAENPPVKPGNRFTSAVRVGPMSYEAATIYPAIKSRVLSFYLIILSTSAFFSTFLFFGAGGLEVWELPVFFASILALTNLCATSFKSEGEKLGLLGHSLFWSLIFLLISLGLIFSLFFALDALLRRSTLYSPEYLLSELVLFPLAGDTLMKLLLLASGQGAPLETALFLLVLFSLVVASEVLSFRRGKEALARWGVDPFSSRVRKYLWEMKKDEDAAKKKEDYLRKNFSEEDFETYLQWKKLGAKFKDSPGKLSFTEKDLELVKTGEQEAMKKLLVLTEELLEKGMLKRTGGSAKAKEDQEQKMAEFRPGVLTFFKPEELPDLEIKDEPWTAQRLRSFLWERKPVSSILGLFVVYGLVLGLFYSFYVAFLPLSLLFLLFAAFLSSLGLGTNPRLIKGRNFHPMARLLPETPKQLVGSILRHVDQKIKEHYIELLVFYLIPLAILVLIPVNDPFSPAVHHPDFLSAAILTGPMPLLLASIIYLRFDALGEGGRTPRKQNLQTGSLVLKGILICGYFILLWCKFDFLGNFILSWLAHIVFSACILFLVRQELESRLLDSFCGGRLKSGKIPAPLFWKRSRQMSAAALAAALILGSLVLLSPAETEFQENAFVLEIEFRQGPIPEDNLLLMEEDTHYTNQTLEFNRSLVISKGTTIFRNCSIIFTNPEAGALGIYVLEDGKLELKESNLSSSSYFNFEVYGELVVENSEISKLQGDRKHRDLEGGLEIYSKASKDQLILVNTTIHDCLTNGIMAGGSDPIIRNCSIYDVNGDGIELVESDALVQDTTIRDCNVGIHLLGSSPRIVNCTVRDVKTKGLLETLSSPEKEGNDIRDPKHPGLDRFFDRITLNILFFLLVGLMAKSTIRKEILEMRKVKAKMVELLAKEAEKEAKEKLEAQGGEGL